MATDTNLNFVLMAENLASGKIAQVGESVAALGPESESTAAQMNAAGSTIVGSNAAVADSMGAVDKSSSAAVASVAGVTGTVDKLAAQDTIVAGANTEVAASLDRVAAQSGVASAGLAGVDVSSASAGAAMTAGAGGASAIDSNLSTAAISAETAESRFIGLKEVIMGTLVPLAAMFGLYMGGQAIIKDTITNFEANQSIQTQLNNTIKQTGDAVGITTAQLNDMADANSKNSTVSANANLSAEQILLSYGAIGSTVFPQAAAATDDLATKMAMMKGQAVPSLTQTNAAAKLLGKALEDPASGMNALTKAGITLSASQKAAIKDAEDGAEATLAQTKSIQGVTAAGALALSKWNELTAAQQKAAEKTDGLTKSQIAATVAFEKQNGTTAAQTLLLQDLAPAHGAAAAEATTLAGKIAILKNNMEEGEISIAKWATGLLPAFGDGLNKAANITISVLSPAFKELTKTIESMGPTLTTLGELLKPVAELFGAALVVAIDAALISLNKFLEVVNAGAEFLQKHHTALLLVQATLVTLSAIIIGQAVVAFATMATEALIAGATMVVAFLPVFLIAAIIGVLVVAGYELIKNWNLLIDYADTLENQLSGTFVKIEDAWWNALDGIYKSIAGFISSQASGMANAGSAMINAFVGGIKGAAMAPYNAVKDILSNVAKLLPHSDAEEGPLSSLTASGRAIPQTMAQGVTQAGGVLKTATSQAFNLAAPSIAGSAGGSPIIASPAISGMSSTLLQQSNQPAPNIIVAPNIGLYAGMPSEKRQIAVDLYVELVKEARAHGVQLPQIGSASVQ